MQYVMSCVPIEGSAQVLQLFCAHEEKEVLAGKQLILAG